MKMVPCFDVKKSLSASSFIIKELQISTLFVTIYQEYIAFLMALGVKKYSGVVAFFFFFFDNLYDIPEIRQAFKNICLDKMLSDGYFDMSAYIYGRLKKEDMYTSLTSAKSAYAVLYQGSYPTQETAADMWRRKIGEQSRQDLEHEFAYLLTYEESTGIVNWVYRALKNASEREEFTKQLFSKLKELHGIKNKIRFSKGVVYNASKVELHFLSSVSGVNSFLSTTKKAGKLCFTVDMQIQITYSVHLL